LIINKTLRDNIIVLFIVTILVVVTTLTYIRFTPTPTVIKDIMQFQPVAYNQQTFLVMAPTRPSMNEPSYIYQVDTTGTLLETFEIQDDQLIAFIPNQNINTPRLFSIGLLGTVLRNYLLDYNLTDNHFEKIELPYKHEDSGVSFAGYYGVTRVFSTIASHITGEQIDQTNTSAPYDPVNGHYRIDSLCTVLTQQCTENNKTTFSLEKNMISFNNDTLLTIRGRLNYESNANGVYEHSLDLYNKDLEPIKNKVITDSNMDNGFQIFFTNNTLILLPIIHPKDDLTDNYYIIDETLGIKKRRYPDLPELKFINENAMQLNADTFLAITNNEDEEHLQLVTFNADNFQIKDITSIYGIEDNDKLVLHSIDYEQGKIYLEVVQHNFQEKRLFIINSNELTDFIEVPLPQVIKNRPSISAIISVSQQ